MMAASSLLLGACCWSARLALSAATGTYSAVDGPMGDDGWEPCQITAGKCECAGFCLDSLRSRTFILEDYENSLTPGLEQQYSMSLCDELPTGVKPFEGAQGGGSKGCAGCSDPGAKCTVVHTSKNTSSGDITCDGAGSAGGGKGVTVMSARAREGEFGVALELRYNFDEMEGSKISADTFYIQVTLDAQAAGHEVDFTDVTTNVAELNSTGANSETIRSVNLTMSPDDANCAGAGWKACEITEGKCECAGYCLDSLRKATFVLQDDENHFTPGLEQKFLLSICDPLPMQDKPFEGAQGGGSKGCHGCSALNAACTAVHTTNNKTSGETSCIGVGSSGSIGGLVSRPTVGGLELRYNYEGSSSSGMLIADSFFVRIELDEGAAGHELAFSDVATKAGEDHTGGADDTLAYDVSLTMSAEDANCNAYQWQPCEISPDKCECAGFCLDSLRGKTFKLEDFMNDVTPDEPQQYILSMCDQLPKDHDPLPTSAGTRGGSKGCEGCSTDSARCTVAHTTTDKSGTTSCDGAGSVGSIGGMSGRRASHNRMELRYNFEESSATTMSADTFQIFVNLDGKQQPTFTKVATRVGENNTGGDEDILAYDVNLTLPQSDVVCHRPNNPSKHTDGGSNGDGHEGLIIAGVVVACLIGVGALGFVIKRKLTAPQGDGDLFTPINDFMPGGSE
jgi:hypothetical protein